ncbi:MAG: class I tRNA ligase family protein [Patescibacteria group bacterium]
MTEYNPKEIEAKWQKEWERQGLHATPDSIEGKENKYVLVEFAYPSGNLHLGHWYAFSIPDVYARLLRMQGHNVLYPMGFDAFGLPAENAAIKRQLNPRTWTFDNIDYMRRQLRSMGVSFDWSREVITATPEYYKWTQWMFLKFLERGLAYQSETPVNWCPSCKTVLANEQVVNGACERCGTVVEKRNMLQWNLKITDYAERLIDGIEPLDWPKPIKDAQKNWIGKSEGAEVVFLIAGSEASVTVFTTRPDTIFGATYMVLAPEHALVQEFRSKINNWNEVEEYISKARNKTDIDRNAEGKEKTGVELKGLKAVNPATKEEIPVWIADYVLPNYGTGAIMAVPADDERDREFAKTFNLPIVTGYPKAGLEDFGKKVTKYKLRDWVVSRQRYWGCPIPVIHCKACGTVPVPEQDLPVVLPDIEDYLPSNEGKSPLAKASAWVNVACPKCGGEAERETDTLDTFVDSSWYFLRYADPKNTSEFASKEKLKQWLPLDFYSGGAEHTTMHLLYSRFWHKVLFDLGLVNEAEPYIRRMNRSLILGPDGQKMSKSKGNVIDPDKEVERLGSDSVRMYLAFVGPYNEVSAYPWNPDGIVGVRRFLERVWRLNSKLGGENENSTLLHQTIKKVGDEIASMKMNTGVSALMILVNDWEKKEKVSQEEYEILLKLLAPFAPHMTEELWHTLGHQTSIHTETWPKYDESRLQSSEVIIAVQINGKVRATFSASSTIGKAEVVEKATGLPEVQKWVGDKGVKKVIYVPGKLVNLVVS